MENKSIVISADPAVLRGIDSKIDGLQTVLTKIQGKSPFAYKKLVVPMSMRSIYWKFFGFPATEDGEILTKVKIVCLLCKTQIAYNRNTSNLRMHLQNKHNDDLLELEALTPPKRPVLSQEAKEKRAQKRLLKAGLNNSQHLYATNSDGTVHIDGDIQFITDPNVNLSGIENDINLNQPVRVMIKGGTNSTPSSSQNVAYLMSETNETQHTTIDSKTVSDVIAEFLIMDLQLPEIVEGRGFQRLVATLRSPVEIPSKSKLEGEIIPKLYDSFRENVTSHLSCIVGEVGLAIEEWKSQSEDTFVTISIYYQNPEEATLENKVLNTLNAPLDWDESQWAVLVDSVLNQWNLKIEKITAVIVSSSRMELYSALTSRGLTIVPCLLHTLQTCARTCFEIPEVASVISKCRAIIGAIAASSTASEALALQEQMLEMEENPLLLDYPAVWTSTYNMLEEMFKRRNLLDSIFDSMENIDREYFELTADQWKILEDLVNVLEPFKVTIMTLGEEKIPLISLLKPLLWQLVSSHLKIKDTDSDMAHELKESLSEMLCDRYIDANVTLFLQISTTLDPRFKQFPHPSEEDRSQVSASLKEMLTTLISKDNSDKKSKNLTESPNKKLRLSGMELLLGNVCSTKSNMPAEEKANLELVQYQSEPTAPLDYCPLQWWAKIAAKCPNMGKLARKYHCVPACCAPSTRLSAEAQILYDSKRAHMPANIVDKLLFLHGNHNA